MARHHRHLATSHRAASLGRLRCNNKTLGPGQLLANWRTVIDANTIGLPRLPVSGIRLYERYLPFSAYSMITTLLTFPKRMVGRHQSIRRKKVILISSTNPSNPMKVLKPMKKFLHSHDGASKGAALIIVLAFVVLATALSLAYFYPHYHRPAACPIEL